ncbi:hypothetical protein NBRC116601_09210 [Cognatishimia sp. WU-CL00825]|uniref:YbjN domain-containing protein n=1 Tax=Cognatishimia sp. WU-CL00825 TaxID=3127658 RepID=UPI003106D8DD
MSGLRTFVAAIGFAVPFALGASAEVIDRVSAPRLVELIAVNGWPHDLQSNMDTGEPVITFEAEGVKMVMRALECESDSCQTLMIFANFDVGRQLAVQDFLAVSDFNDANMLGRSYVNLQENKIGLDLVVDLRGGVTEEHLRLNIAEFPAMVSAFLAHYVQFSEHLAAQQR